MLYDVVEAWRSPLEDVVRDADRADLTEGGGGRSSGAIWAEAEAQNERGEMGTGVRVEGGRRVAGGEGRRHGCRDGQGIREHTASQQQETMIRGTCLPSDLATIRAVHSPTFFFVMLIFSFACDPELTFR
jgi:hypothetical protein